MIRTINETFTFQEHKMLSKLKGELSWHDFIMLLASNFLKIKGVPNARS